MSTKTILTGRRRTLTTSGNLSAQAAFIRYIYSGATTPGVIQCGGSSANTGINGGTVGGFRGPGISFFFNNSFTSPVVRVSLTNVGSAGATYIDVPVNPGTPPTPSGRDVTTSASAYIVTATVSYSVVIELVEIEVLDTGYGSRQFLEVLANDRTSSITATLSVGTSSVSATETQVGGDPVTTSRTSWNVFTASLQATCSAFAFRTDVGGFYDGGPRYTGFGPSYTLTASATAVNSVVGCDFSSPRNPTKVATGASASSNTATATAPSDTAKEAYASFEQKIFCPKTIFQVEVKSKSIGGTDLIPPYSTTGTGYVAYRSTSAGGTGSAPFDKSQPFIKKVIFGNGYTRATAYYGDKWTGSPPVTSADIDNVEYPYEGNIAPTGTILITSQAQPGACVANATGTPSGDAFQPAGTYSIYRKCSNSLSICGVKIVQNPSVVIADYPFLSSGRFSGAWSANMGGTVTEVSGSRLRIAAGDTLATTATLLFPSSMVVGYRWLRARVPATVAVAITVTAEQGTTSGTVILSGTIAVKNATGDYYFDILGTLRNIAATANTGTGESAITNYRRITITVPAGKQIDIDYLRWERRNSSLLTILPFFGTTLSGDNAALASLNGFTDGMPTRGIDRTVTSLSSILTRFAANSAQNGWAASYFGPVAQASTTLNDFNEAGYLNGLEPSLDASVASMVSYRGDRSTHAVLAYYGCGEVLSQGAYSDTCNVRYDVFLGSQVTGTIINAKPDKLKTTKTSDSAALLSSRDFTATSYYGALTPDILQSVGTTTKSDKPVNYVVQGGAGTVSTAAKTITWNASFTDARRLWVGFAILDSARRVANISHPYLGWYGELTIPEDGKTVVFRRSNGPFRGLSSFLPDVTLATATGTDTFSLPAVSLEFTPLETLRARWQKETSDGIQIYESVSNADGVPDISYGPGSVWSDPVMALPNARQPILTTFSDSSGLILESGFVPDSATSTTGSSSVGIIQAKWINRAVQSTSGIPYPPTITFKKVDSPGGTASDLRITDAGFDLVQLHEGQSQVCLLCTPEGETGLARYLSADEGVFTFIRVTS